MRKSGIRFTVLVAIALSGLVVGVARPQEAARPPDELILGGNWPDPNRSPIPPDEMIFHIQSKGTYESESVFFMAYFNNGWILMSSLFQWNYGPMKRWGIYSLVSSPEGKRYWAREQIDEKNVKLATDHLFFLQGPNYVEGSGMTYKYKVKIQNFACDLTFNNIVPPFRPGTGFAYFDPKKEFYQYTGSFSPWADVTGTITLPDRTLQVKGEGYADKARSTLSPMKLSPYIIDFRVFSPSGTPKPDRWFINMLEYRTHPGFGSKRVPFIFLCHGDKIVMATKLFDITTDEWTQGQNSPYKYPKKMKIHAKSNGYTLDGTYTCATLFDYTDIMSELPGWVRSIVEKFVKRPVFFRSRGQFEGTVLSPDGKSTPIKLVGPSEYVVAK